MCVCACMETPVASTGGFYCGWMNQHSLSAVLIHIPSHRQTTDPSVTQLCSFPSNPLSLSLLPPFPSPFSPCLNPFGLLSLTGILSLLVHRNTSNVNLFFVIAAEQTSWYRDPNGRFAARGNGVCLLLGGSSNERVPVKARRSKRLRHERRREEKDRRLVHNFWDGAQSQNSKIDHGPTGKCVY